MKTLFLCGILFSSVLCNAATLGDTISPQPHQNSMGVADVPTNVSLKDVGKKCETTLNGVTLEMDSAGEIVKIKNSAYEISLAQSKKTNGSVKTPLLLLNNVAIPLKLSVATPEQKRKAQSKMRQLLATFSEKCKNVSFKENDESVMEKSREKVEASSDAAMNTLSMNSNSINSVFATESVGKKSAGTANGTNDDGGYDDEIDPEWFTSSFWSDYSYSNYSYIMNDF